MANSQPKQLVMFYADLGRPYQALIERTLTSAVAVMPDIETVILTPTPKSSVCGLFDTVVHVKTEASPDTICMEKARAIVSWQSQTKEPVVYVDPDLEFRKPLIMPAEDVGLLWRRAPTMPINTGMIFANPGAAEFWWRYGRAAVNCPKPTYAWYCDQLAMSVIFGSLHHAGEVVNAYGARVLLMPYEKICAHPEAATEETWTLHFKGSRKGSGWEKYFIPRKKSGAGKSSPVSASSTATA